MDAAETRPRTSAAPPRSAPRTKFVKTPCPLTSIDGSSEREAARIVTPSRQQAFSIPPFWNGLRLPVEPLKPAINDKKGRSWRLTCSLG